MRRESATAVPFSELEAYAQLVLGLGAGLARGQDLFVDADIAHAPLVRAIVRGAYAAGAARVDVHYDDQHVRRASLVGAPTNELGWSPTWRVARVRTVAECGAALVSIVGEPYPRMFDDLDETRIAASRRAELDGAYLELVQSGAVNWTVVPFPTHGWAAEIERSSGRADLWDLLRFALRLDTSDPSEEWRAQLSRLGDRAAVLNAMEIDQLVFRGPGTDLEVGLTPSARWCHGRFVTADGRTYSPNLPTEEVFTAPDRRRTQGVVRTTRPTLVRGALVDGVTLEFESGRLVSVTGGRGKELVERETAVDPGASMLGEVALVDASSRLFACNVVFGHPLLDENASSHIAYGAAIPQCVSSDADMTALDSTINRSGVHTDLPIGGLAVDVDAVTSGGRTVAVLREGHWCLREGALVH